MESETGVSLFPWIPQKAGTALNFEELWAQIRVVPHPGPAPTIQISPAKPSDSANNLKGWNSRRKGFAWGAAVLPLFLIGVAIPVFFIIVACIAAFAIVYQSLDRSKEFNEIRQRKESATSEWTRIDAEWKMRAGDQAFDSKLSELEMLKRELDNLPNVRIRKLNELQGNLRQIQLEEFLDRFEIEDAVIAGIGHGRKQTLASYNVETAADITNERVEAVPGFGPVLCSKLMDWRRCLEVQFVFDPGRKINPRHLAKIEQDILSEKRRIEDKLRSGPAELRALGAQILAARQHMRPQVEAAYARYLQATADFDVANT
jgi:DNA-binding helix-hairpin-helix protein with protein kinase domain